MQTQDGVDALFFGRVDKTAGIDDNDIRFAALIRHLKITKFTQHNLRIDEVFGTAQRYDMELFNRFLFGECHHFVQVLSFNIVAKLYLILKMFI